MPIYEYTAINPDGKQVKGSIDADNLRAARQRLRSQRIYPTDIKESSTSVKWKTQDVGHFFRAQKIGLKDLAIATRQLATLLGAGLPLVSALLALADQTDSAVLQRVIVDVREDVEEGSSLAKAFGAFPKSFPRLYVNMVAAGEASGTLDLVLSKLADHLEAQLDLRTKVRSALVYPVLMLIICTLVILGLFVFVVPNIVEIFIKQNAELPVPTRVMIWISDFLIHYWLLLLAAALTAPAALRWYYAQESGRERLDRLLLKLPIYGSIYVKVCTARVSSTLGTLLESGVQLLNALDITRNIVGNVHIADALDGARDGVREGKSLAKELAKPGIFPPMLFHMIAVGEKSGQLEAMLLRAGNAYQKEVNSTLEGLTSILEPLLMIVVGCIVLVIVMSVLVPMVDLIDIMQR